MKEIFDNYIETPFGEFHQARFKFKQFDTNYRRLFPNDKDAAVLDIGVGRGEMLSCMKEWGYKQYLGVDISSSTITFCQSIGLQCQLVDDTTEWLRDCGQVFSLVSLLDVLEHIRKEQTIPFLRAIFDVLGEGGVLLVQVPNLQAPDGQLERYNDFTHEVGYIEHSLQQVLLAAGFSNVEIFPFNDSITDSWKETVRLGLRALYWKWIRFSRKINGAINPQILTPTFYAVAVK
jgi:2-polyprenyl-3-methyl-5-hydroxy-6-metoxy-1,4-benzoquinol methylase